MLGFDRVMVYRFEPGRRGFGSTVIERTIPFELRGTAALRYEAGGLEADFTIPPRFVRPGTEAPAPPAAAVPAAAPPRASGTALVLVLEDSTLLALDAEEILLALGFERVEVAGSAAAARLALERIGEELSFALLDVNLGDSTSLPVAEELRRRGIPFAFATGYGNGLELPEEIREGVAIVPKPYQRQDIAEAVGRSLRAGEG